MTLDEFRALRDATSNRWLARAIGRDESTVRDWCDGPGPTATAAEWLGRVRAITPTRITVHTSPGIAGRPKRAA